MLNGLPEKWLENIYLENIEVKNSIEGVRLNRVKNLIMKNVTVESQKRALVADDVYEFFLDNVQLNDQTGGVPVLLQGYNTGVVVMPSYLNGDVEFGIGLDENVIMKELPSAEW